MDLKTFLLARIAEDEAEAAEYGYREFFEGGWTKDHTARVIAECAAKRELVDIWHDEHGGGHVLKTLAAVYADHPDYQPEWAA